MGPNKLTLPPNINLWLYRKDSPNKKNLAQLKIRIAQTSTKLTQTTIRNLYI